MHNCLIHAALTTPHVLSSLVVTYPKLLKEKDRTSEKFKATVEETKDRIVPTWLDAKKDEFSATVTRLPSTEDIDYEVATHLIVELYSK